MGTFPEKYAAHDMGEVEPNGSLPWRTSGEGAGHLAVVTECPCNDGMPRTVYLANPFAEGEFPEGWPAGIWQGFSRIEGKLFRHGEGFEFISIQL